MTKHNSTIKTAASTAALTLALAGIAGAASATGNPFGATSLESGYQVASHHKEGEGKCGEAKCGEAKGEEGKCGEAKCGEAKGEEGKCGEAKCGGEEKAAEGKCGEAKCGGDA